MAVQIPPMLEKLYAQFDACSRCQKSGNPLRHILGGGKFFQPRFLFLFINPTHHNRSSHAEYEGVRRFPFIGVRYFYRILAESGFIDKEIIEDIYKQGWQWYHEKEIEDNLVTHSIYITNLVKCTQPHADSPSPQIIAQDLPFLKKEIDLVQSKSIVAFGKLPIKILTHQEVRLKDYLESISQGSYGELTSFPIEGREYPVLPCYFPVGRESSES